MTVEIKSNLYISEYKLKQKLPCSFSSTVPSPTSYP